MTYKPFKRAVPVFAEGLQHEKNVTCGFYGKINRKNEGKVIFKAAASSFYKLYINGEFVNYGPVRCGHGVYRVDEIDITDKMKNGANHVAVEVVGYNINSYYVLDQPSFLQCEIFNDEESILATLPDDKPHRRAFSCFLLDARIRKTQKYSFQRAFTEGYNLYPGVFEWRKGDFSKARQCGLEKTDKKELTERVLPLNNFTKAVPARIEYEGRIERVTLPENRWRDRCLVKIGDTLKGFREDELELHLSDEMQTVKVTEKRPCGACYHGFDVLSEGQATMFSMKNEKTGFITLDIDCLTDEGEFFIMFDETLQNGDVEPLCKDVCNGLKISCKKGVYHFSSFECYGFKYFKYVVTKGKFVLSDFSITEYASPCEITYEYKGENEAHKRVIDAAVETYRQNSADAFMDCPTRERAGWLCDSFFTARSEKLLTGKNVTEYVFLQNFLLSKGFTGIPEGMIPMCYPADHYDGVFIPNWAMWFVLELKDALERGQDEELIYAMKSKVYGLLKYLKGFENEFGLLENLPSWIFIEWSKANDLVRDVNYPTNMCYSAVLRAAGDMYGDKKLLSKSVKLVRTIRKRSFNGSFFRDREIRRNGISEITDEVTETCQYYAFFFDIATPEKYPGLWKKLVTKFGPDRAKKGFYPEIYGANSFIGNYLRLDILARYGLYSQLSEEIGGYFDYMAKQTGTLWENASSCASCNHGFASYAAYFIDKCSKYDK